MSQEKIQQFNSLLAEEFTQNYYQTLKKVGFTDDLMINVLTTLRSNKKARLQEMKTSIDSEILKF